MPRHLRHLMTRLAQGIRVRTAHVVTLPVDSSHSQLYLLKVATFIAQPFNATCRGHQLGLPMAIAPTEPDPKTHVL